MPISITPKVLQKLADKHQVSEKEIEECFANRTGGILYDTREQHQSDPPTLWFVAHTNKARLLKVCFVLRGATAHIRTAYSANADELAIYRKKGKPSDF